MTTPTLTIHPSFKSSATPKPTPEQQAERIATLCRELYKTNEGPSLIAEMIEREFPHPRKVISGPGYKTGGGEWGILATSSPKP